MTCDQMTRRDRPCRNRVTGGHNGTCTFHWHRMTIGHRAGWPAGWTAPCCEYRKAAPVARFLTPTQGLPFRNRTVTLPVLELAGPHSIVVPDTATPQED